MNNKTLRGTARRRAIVAARHRVHRFRDDESGSFVIFSLFVLVAMILAVGTAIDTMRYEVTRTKLQNTLDRAVLAAADLDQPLPPLAVVDDYFARAELDDYLGDVKLTEGLNYRTVEASSEADIQTMFLNLVGMNEMQVPAAGAANETITDVEISLVLDNSGSMGWNSNRRLELLKDAAQDFIDVVMKKGPAGDDKVSVSIIPFATQVSAGPDLINQLNVTQEHTDSYCVNFSSSDFTKSNLSPSQQLKRTGHFDPFNTVEPPNYWSFTCSPDSRRHITPYSADPAYLKQRIEDFVAAGNTSIDVGAKWGLALLDPAFRIVLSNLVNTGKVSTDFSGRPYDYTEEQVLKVLVVMSDGQNTSQYMLRDQYRSGASRLYEDSSNGRESFYWNRSNTSYDYYWDYHNYWRWYPYYDWDRATRLSWPEVWKKKSIRHFAKHTVEEAIGGSADSIRWDYMTTVNSGTKNTRTSQICKAARDKGVTVYTIGMDTYGQGDATLLDCATSPAYFFDVEGLEIADAFLAIARDINRLRLTH